MLTVVPGEGSGHEGGKDGSRSLIDEIVREGARRMLAEALAAEVDAYIAAFAAERDESGRRLVVRNGYHQRGGADQRGRGRGDRATGQRQARRPGHRRAAPVLLGNLATVVPSAPVITRLTQTWQAERAAFAQRDLSQVDYVYLWADGIHVNIRLEEHKLCLLVMIGVRADGRKELVADGYRESAESWADLLRDCARRGMRAPVLAVGDGALGFWNGLREVFPQAREGRCWFHKTANVLAALPKSAHPGAKKALAEIWGAEDKTHALAAVKAFQAAYGAKFPKAVAKITDDVEELLAFYDYPAEHWVHLRTTNPIESTFATVRHRTKVTKGPGSRAAGLAMAFKLIESAQDRWRAVNAPHLVALVRAGATFIGGKLIERPGEETQPEAA
jgi:transposase-like protein